MKKLYAFLLAVALLGLVPGCAPVSLLFARPAPATESPTSDISPAAPVSYVPETATLSQGQVLDELQDRLAVIYAEVNPSVVAIQVVGASEMQQFGDPDSPFNMPDMPRQGSGSGFVWDTEGHIVTNHHVVADADEITVRFYDGALTTAVLVGSDPNSDLAVIKVDVPAERLHPVRVADSATVEVGQLVIAIGSPFGLENTMTVGFVSALGRSLPVESTSFGGSRFTMPDIIQTDAPINPGNSGGVLLNDEGEVVGVTSAIISPVQASVGIGFAIPSVTVSKVIPALITDGRYAHAWLGISGTTLTPDIAEAMELDPEQRGALVIEVVSSGPSEAAGLQGSDRAVEIDGFEMLVGGDIIIALEDTEVKDFDGLVAALSRYSAGQQITLDVLRDGEVQTLDVTLGERPD